MSKEAQRIMTKYPGHVPVICTGPSTNEDRKKFLIPASMVSKDVAATVREKCPWATAESSIVLGGEKVLSQTEQCSAQELYEKYKSTTDGFLHLVVHPESVEALSMTEDVASPTSDFARATSDEADDKNEPSVFHMPDYDQENDEVSHEAKRVRKVIAKHPDHLPVIVRQAATAGLPHIDKKLLVPCKMSCAGLQGVLPKHLGLPTKEGEKWKALRIYMGDVPILESAMMSDVYEQYVDEDDGGLHLTIGIEGESDQKNTDEIDLVVLSQQLAEAREENAQKDDLLADAEEKAMAAITAERERADELEGQVEELMVTVQSSKIEANMHQGSMEEARERIAQLESQLLESEEARQESEAARRVAQETAFRGGQQILMLQEELEASKQHSAKTMDQAKLHEAVAANVKELEEAKSSVDRMSNLLTSETADKERAQARVRALSERVAAVEAEQAKQASKKKELEADGFVDLGWDGDGFAGGCGDEFEVVAGR